MGHRTGEGHPTLGPSNRGGGGGGGSTKTLALFSRAFSYGHGVAADQQLPAATSWWFSPTTIADLAVANQVREWETNDTLGFLKLVVYVDAATLPINIDSPSNAHVVITINGAETPVSVTIPAGVSAGLLLEQTSLFAVAAGSRIGVKLIGTEVQAAASLRCEVNVSGALTGTPLVPPALPVLPLFIFESETLSLTGSSWSDTSGNHFDVADTGLPPGYTKPTVVPGAFNGLRGAHFGLLNALQTTDVVLAGANPPAARSVMMVVKPDNITGGSFLTFNIAAAWFACLLWDTAGNQFAYDNGVVNSQLSAIVSYAGEPVILLWRCNGTRIQLFVNGVLRASTTNTVGSDITTNPGLVLGNNLANLNRGCLSTVGGAWGWARDLSDSDVLSANAYAFNKYIG